MFAGESYGVGDIVGGAVGVVGAAVVVVAGGLINTSRLARPVECPPFEAPHEQRRVVPTCVELLTVKCIPPALPSGRAVQWSVP
jgi:hypothetical protein